MYKNFAQFSAHLARISTMQRLGLAAALGGIGGFATIIGAGLASHVSGNRSHLNGQFPKPTITCTAKIPAPQAGGETEVVFTGRIGGDGYSMNTTGLRPSQSVEIDGSMNPYGDTTRFDPNQYHNIDSSLGGKPTITDLRNATLAVVEGGGYTHTSIPISCPAAGRG